MPGADGDDSSACTQTARADSGFIEEDEKPDESVAGMSLLQFMRSLLGADDDTITEVQPRSGPFSRPGSANWLRVSRPVGGVESSSDALPQSKAPAMPLASVDLTAKATPRGFGGGMAMRTRGAAASTPLISNPLFSQFSHLSDVEMRPGTALVESPQLRGQMSAFDAASREGSCLGVTEVSLADMSPHLFAAQQEAPSSSARHESTRLRAASGVHAASADAHAAWESRPSSAVRGSANGAVMPAPPLPRTDSFDAQAAAATATAAAQQSNGAENRRPGSPQQRTVQSARLCSPSEPVLDESVWTKQAMARPPSRQKPPPEALHLFAGAGGTCMWDGERVRRRFFLYFLPCGAISVTLAMCWLL